MKFNKEYNLCKQIAYYLKYQYPNCVYHFDLTGLNLSKAQAGMSKAIQHGRGYPDLFIAQPSVNNSYNGLFIEIKPEDVKLFKARMLDSEGNLNYATPHIKEQAEMLQKLSDRGYMAVFGIGFNDCKTILDNYLKK